MDFSIIPGRTGYVFWRHGLVKLWQKRFWRRPERPKRTARKPPEVKVGLDVIVPETSIVAQEGPLSAPEAPAIGPAGAVIAPHSPGSSPGGAD
jgi:hypothetical protein